MRECLGDLGTPEAAVPPGARFYERARLARHGGFATTTMVYPRSLPHVHPFA